MTSRTLPQSQLSSPVTITEPTKSHMLPRRPMQVCTQVAEICFSGILIHIAFVQMNPTKAFSFPLNHKQRFFSASLSPLWKCDGTNNNNAIRSKWKSRLWLCAVKYRRYISGERYATRQSTPSDDFCESKRPLQDQERLDVDDSQSPRS